MGAKDDASGSDGRGRQWSSVWKVLVVVVAVAAFYYIPRQGYETYDRKAAVAEILKRAKPLQDRYLASAGTAAVSGAGNSALNGRYLSAGNEDDAKKLAFDWSMKLENSKVKVDLGPGFDGEQHYSIVLTPVAANGRVEWDCTGGSLPQRYRTPECRRP